MNVACFLSKGAQAIGAIVPLGIGTTASKLLVSATTILVGCDISDKGDNGFEYTCHYDPPDIAGSGVANPLDNYGFRLCTFPKAAGLTLLTFQVSATGLNVVTDGQ